MHSPQFVKVISGRSVVPSNETSSGLRQLPPHHWLDSSKWIQLDRPLVHTDLEVLELLPVEVGEDARVIAGHRRTDARVIAGHRRTDARELSRSLRGELDWIVMTALEKDRERRYDTANSFAGDIQRFFNDEAVQACPPSTAYRMHKFVRRHRGPVIATSALLLVLCLGLLGTTIGLALAANAWRKS